jgi:5-oxoprolinase (ATP-hydrolysing) subunit A
MQVDLNCDMGEGIGNDAAIMPFISSANIACGYHAGDHITMHETVALALKFGVAVGAHPSYPDKENFGRMAMTLSPIEIYALTFYQIGALHAIAQSQGAVLNHVKPHGALYNAAAVSDEISQAIATAIFDFNPQLALLGLANSAMIQAAKTKGLKFKHEVFADRTYQSNGTLTPRTQPSALIESEEGALKQVLQMVKQNTVTAVDGSTIPIQTDSICIHGDGKHAVEFACALHTKLKAEGIQIKAS